MDTKQLYTGKAFRESNKLIFEKNWPEAIHKLKELTGNSDPDIARKAKHNLDIAVEASEAKEH